MFVDTHAHIYAKEFDDDVHNVVRNAFELGVQKILMPAIDSSSYAAMNKLAKLYPDTLFPMIGLHPSSVNKTMTTELDFVAMELQTGRYCAVGEIGIDLYWDKSWKMQQCEAFEKQLYLADAFHLPVVIHQRESFHEIFAILQKPAFKNLRGVFHCFAGDVNIAHQCIEMGFYLGIGGVVTYKNSTMAKVVKEISLEYLLLETDSPYLPPVPYRGKRNEPSYITVIASKIAELKNCSVEEVATITTNNAMQLFFS